MKPSTVQRLPCTAWLGTAEHLIVTRNKRLPNLNKFSTRVTYLMQFSGSPSQSVLQRNRSQESQPIGGVRARPLSRLQISAGRRNTVRTNDTITAWKMQIVCRGAILLRVGRVDFVPPFDCRCNIILLRVVGSEVLWMIEIALQCLVKMS